MNHLASYPAIKGAAKRKRKVGLSLWSLRFIAGSLLGTLFIIPAQGWTQPVTRTFQDGIDGYSGTRDTRIMSIEPTFIFGSDTLLKVDGSPEEATLIFWDLADIPIGSIVQSVEITVIVTNLSGATYDLYELKRPWLENEATWMEFASGEAWQKAGADSSEDRGSTSFGELVGSAFGPITVALNQAGIAAVQSWVNDPSSNHGFVIQDYINHNNDVNFLSRESLSPVEHPKLTVTYMEGVEPSISIDDIMVAEGDTGNADAVFTVMLSNIFSELITVNYATSDGTANAGIDYSGQSGQVDFQVGEVSKPVKIPVKGNLIKEENKTFMVDLSNPINSSLSISRGIATILDDDGGPINVPADYATIQEAFDAAAEGDTILVAPGIHQGPIEIANKSVVLASWFITGLDTSYISQTIIDGNGGSAVITIKNTAGPNTKIIGLTVRNAGDGISPRAKFDILHCRITNTSDGIDYEAGSGGVCKFNIFENNSDDGIDLDNEVEITIEDNIIRNNKDDGIEFRMQPYQGPVLNVIIRNNKIYGNREDGIQLIDYDGLSSRNIVIERNLIYNNEMAGLGCMGGGVTKENYEGASILERVFIFNNTFSGNTYGLTGGDSLVALNNLFANHSVLAMKNVDGGSIAAYGIFWNNFADHENSHVDSATAIYSDPLLDSEFRLQAGSPAVDAGTANFSWFGKTILDLPPDGFKGSAPDIGAIESDGESLPGILIDDVTIIEGDSGTVDAVFNLSLSSASSRVVTVDYETADGSAMAGIDYESSAGQVTFSPGETVQSIIVIVNGDSLEEPHETFFVDLTGASNASINDDRGMATIANDDGTQLVTATFQDGLHGYDGTRDTKLMSVSPTANFGSEIELEIDGSPDESTLLYWDLTGIPPGSVIQTASIVVNVTDVSGATYEIYEMLRPWTEYETTWMEFSAGQSWSIPGADSIGDRASAVLGAFTGENPGLTTITLNQAGVAVIQSWLDDHTSNHGFIGMDYINHNNSFGFSSREAETVVNRPKLTVSYTNDSQPFLTINDVSVQEGNSSDTLAEFTVALTIASSQTISVDYFTSDGTATANDDYEATSSSSVTFQPGETSRTIEIPVHGDEIWEPNEEFFVELRNPTNATIIDFQGRAEIINDDGVGVVRGPYLQVGTPSSVTVRWRTSQACESVVRYGVHPDSLTMSFDFPGLTVEHEVTLSGLSFDTRYYYSIGTVAETVAGGDSTYFFVTSPEPGTPKPTRVWILGDSGKKNKNARSVRDAYYNFAGKSHTDLWLMLGDNAYSDGTDNDYQEAVFENMFEMMLRKSVLWPTLGNHDAHTNSIPGPFPYYEIFTLPEQGEAGGVASGTEAYYSFDYGNLHFICLNSSQSELLAIGSEMWTWLQEDLAANDKVWTIAFWHHPPYSKGTHDSDTESVLRAMRERAVPLLEAGGVDLVLTGHSHNYERSFLLDGFYERSDFLAAEMILDYGDGRIDGDGAYDKGQAWHKPHGGTVYVVAGNSGQVGMGSLDHPAHVISFSELGSLVMDVNDKRLDVKMLSDQGTVRDYFTLIKGDLTPLLTVDDVTVTEGNTQADSVNAKFTVTLHPATEDTVLVEYTTLDSTANSPDDYSHMTGQLTFLPGETSKWISVPILSDSTEELDELFSVRLSHPTNAVIEDSAGTGTIKNDDGIKIVTVSLQDGLNGYNATRDTKLLAEKPDDNFGSSARLEIDGRPFEAALLYWDLTGIPVGSLINAAEITVNVTNTSSSSYELYEMKQPWIENEATWNEFATGLNWELAGANGVTDRGVTVIDSVIGSSLGLKSIVLDSLGVELVQSWINKPSDNHGFIILDYKNASNGFDFSSRETGIVAERPMLTLTYSVTLSLLDSANSVLKMSAVNHIDKVIPEDITLTPSYPNPFNLETRIDYTLSRETEVRLVVYNIRGQMVRVLVDEIQPAGYKTALWLGVDEFGREVGSGLYFIQLIADDRSFVRKVSLLK